MKRYLTGIFTLIAIAGVLFGVIWIGRPHSDNGATRGSAAAQTLIEISRPTRRNITRRIQWFGTVESQQSVRLMSLTEGTITRVNAENGTPVKQGDVLFTIGGSRVSATMETLRQHVSALDKRVSLAETIVTVQSDAAAALEWQIALAQRIVEIKRAAVAKRINKKEDVLAAEEHLAQLHAEKTGLKKNLLAAEGLLNQLNADVSTARRKLAAFKNTLLVTSPMDGLFVNRRVTMGQKVSVNTPLADILSNNEHITTYLYPPAHAALKGKPSAIYLSEGVTINGTVTRVIPERTAEGATIVWIAGDAVSAGMKPGETAYGDIALEVRKDIVTITQDAVIRDERERTYIFVKTPQGYRKKSIRTGLSDNGWIEVISGLSETDDVVVKGAYELYYRTFSKTYKAAD